MENLLRCIDEILDLEWELFQAVRNIGGQASCQNDRKQFFIMRCAQFSAWSSPAAAAYLEDLRQAKESGSNPLTLKYAYMMKSTSPAEFQELASKLPPVSPEKQELVEKLVAQTILWCEAFARQYPRIAAHGRPLRSQADRPGVTSVETYSRGENSSYSVETLKALLRHYESMKNEGVNLHERIVESEMRLMGIESLAEAEAILSRR